MLAMPTALTSQRLRLRTDDRRARRTKPDAVRNLTPRLRQHEVYSVRDDTLPTLLLYRDSFATALIPFLAEHFRRADAFWSSAPDPGMIAAVQPDYVLWEVVERYPHRPLPDIASPSVPGDVAREIGCAEIRRKLGLDGAQGMSSAAEGYVGSATRVGGHLSFSGWAVALDPVRPAARILACYEGRFAGEGAVTESRGDVVRRYDEPGLVSGFRVTLQTGSQTIRTCNQLDFYAISPEGRAGRLKVSHLCQID